jgi:hypothetical protein
MSWIHLAQFMGKWWDDMNIVINIWVDKRREISYIAERLLASPEGLCTIPALPIFLDRFYCT